MAVWQFAFYLIKKENVNLFDESKPWGEGKNEELLAWHINEIKQESIQKIAEILPIEKSWSNDIKQYGKIDETCIEISLDDMAKYCIRVRLDMRSLSRELLRKIICFIQSNNADIVYCFENKCYQADEETLLRLIKNSNAYKFCEDPVGFLTSLDNLDNVTH
ncbi:MAG: hypothetical protein FWE22_00715 [Firmicutes bacterium]|nr:hypothetical protein [Bacillota bacterium]